MDAKRITDNLVKKLEEELSVFTTERYSVLREDTGDYYTIYVRNAQDGHRGSRLYSPIANRVINVLNKYDKKYDMFWIINTVPTLEQDNEGNIKFDRGEKEWVYQPQFEISIRK